MPGSVHWPGWSAVRENIWNTSTDAEAFPPKVWGYGWSLNFAYPLIDGKPLWKRVLVFAVGLVTMLLLIYLLIVLGVLLYYVLTPPPPEQVLTIVLE